MNRETIKNTMLLAMSEHHSGNADEACRIIDAQLTALEAAGVRLVPAQLNSKNLEHWKIASAGINAIEDYGGEFGCDHTPERQIADAYRDMVQIAASPYFSPGNHP